LAACPQAEETIWNTLNVWKKIPLPTWQLFPQQALEEDCSISFMFYIASGECNILMF
jgi:hypothetical protein